MSRLTRGLIVAAIHVGLAASLGAKLLVDRTNYPRAWARTAPFDPDLPIRGRYVRLRVEARMGPGFEVSTTPSGSDGRDLGTRPVDLSAMDGALVATPSTGSDGLYAAEIERDGSRVMTLMTPVAFFIPEHVPDPSIRPVGEELWVELTIPPTGPPRPIRLAVKRDGVLTALDLD